MASTAHKSEEAKKEFFDSEEILDQKVKQLAEWIRNSKHFIVFTGAGISTSTGIPDFRSGYNTVLPTGPGAWEVKAQKKPVQNVKRISTLQAIPSNTHMSLVKLMQEGMLKFLVSQNCDGLHRRSGVQPENISELHGNSNLEKCVKCKKGYMRDFTTWNNSQAHTHLTGRLCDDPSCKGQLKDTIINFGENLELEILEKAM